jgi:hypothetical protein
VLETDAAEAAEGKLRHVVAEAIADPVDVDWALGHLRPLVGLGDDVERSPDSRAEVFAAWRKFFEAIAEKRPLVLVFEDLQWADDGLLDFVDHLVEWASGVSLVCVCTARPELLERRPDWGGGNRNATTLSLSPLSDEDTTRLVHALLDTSVLPAEFHSTLLDRAGGNPLYAEEFAHLVQERGHDGALSLPESVQFGARRASVRGLCTAHGGRGAPGPQAPSYGLDRALAFFRGVGATAYLRRAEALFAASA